MKKSGVSMSQKGLLRGCMAFLFLSMCVLVGASYAQQPAQTYPIMPSRSDNSNDGFEENNGVRTIGWSSFSQGGSRWTLTEEQAHSGKRSMMLKGSGENKFAWLVSESLRARPGDCIDFLIWSTTKGARNNQITVWVEAFIDKEWRIIEPRSNATMLRRYHFVNNWEWKPRGHVVVAPQGTRSIRLVASCGLGDSPDTALYVDDFSCRISSLSKYVDEHANAERLPDISWTIPDAFSKYFVGAYGAKNSHTPNLDKLVSEGRCFNKAMTPASWTRPAFASMFTSLYPAQHTAELVNSPLPTNFITLAQLLKERGYFTAAFIRSPYDGFVGPGMGYNKGFDVFAYSDDENQVFDAAKQFLDRNAESLLQMKGGGLFIVWHFAETHGPYENWMRDIIKNSGSLGDITITDDRIMDMALNHDMSHFDKGDMKYARECYETEVTLFDTRLGELLSRMKRLGLYEKLNIVMCSDHGESFGEKEWVWNHGHSYNTCSGVPLIMRFPDRMSPEFLSGEPLVSTLDVMPTLLTLTGCPIPPQCEGRSLLSGADGRTAHYVACEGKSRAVLDHGSFAIRDEQYELVVLDAAIRKDPNDWTSSRWMLFEPNTPSKFELYDVENDPFQLKDLSQELPDVFERMKQAAAAHAAHVGMSNEVNQNAPKVELSTETKEGLAAIGYLSDDAKHDDKK
jgi:arylsulfatase A-like enzyme